VRAGRGLCPTLLGRGQEAGGWCLGVRTLCVGGVALVATFDLAQRALAACLHMLTGGQAGSLGIATVLAALRT
jgi:hypothetical protein